MYRVAFLAGLTVLSGCSTHPITGRNQILALPTLQAAHAETRFALSAGVQRIAEALPCLHDCGDAERLAAFARRTTRIGATLEAAARDKSPELFERIKGFQIEMNDNLGVGTGSSAGGRIALGTGLDGLEPTDTVLAFLIAREMAHVIARHAEEDSGASLVFSVLGMLLLPGFGLVLRTLATTLGSSVVKSSWAMDQLREADEIAVALLEHAGTPASQIAHALETGVKRSVLPDDGWGAGYLDSTRRVVAIAVPAGIQQHAQSTREKQEPQAGLMLARFLAPSPLTEQLPNEMVEMEGINLKMAWLLSSPTLTAPTAWHGHPPPTYIAAVN